MKQQRIYIDTSVFGGYFDVEFEAFTKPLFNRIKQGEFIILFSTVTEEELELAPDKIKKLVTDLRVDQTEFLGINEEAVDLATEYISEKVVGKTSFADCLHIALATIHRADLLISWNFKHIVNIERIRGYNSINIKNGYKQLEIRSPRELINYGDEDLKKGFDAVQYMREQRKSLSDKLSKMTKPEIVEYFKKEATSTQSETKCLTIRHV